MDSAAIPCRLMGRRGHGARRQWQAVDMRVLGPLRSPAPGPSPGEPGSPARAPLQPNRPGSLRDTQAQGQRGEPRARPRSADPGGEPRCSHRHGASGLLPSRSTHRASRPPPLRSLPPPALTSLHTLPPRPPHGGCPPAGPAAAPPPAAVLRLGRYMGRKASKSRGPAAPAAPGSAGFGPAARRLTSCAPWACAPAAAPAARPGRAG